MPNQYDLMEGAALYPGTAPSSSEVRVNPKPPSVPQDPSRLLNLSLPVVMFSTVLLSALNNAACVLAVVNFAPAGNYLLGLTFAFAAGNYAVIRSCVAALMAERWPNGHRFVATIFFFCLLVFFAGSWSIPVLLTVMAPMNLFDVEIWWAMAVAWILIDVAATILPTLQPTSTPRPPKVEPQPVAAPEAPALPKTRAGLWAYLAVEAITVANANPETVSFNMTTTQRALAERLDVGKSTVNRWLQALEADGLISVHASLSETRIVVHLRGPGNADAALNVRHADGAKT